MAAPLEDIRVQYALWEDLPEGVKAVFAAFTGGDMGKANAFYTLYFYAYNIPHEMGHVLRFLSGSRTALAYDEELACNRFAVAYWRACEANHLLAQLNRMLLSAMQYIQDPCPPSEDRAAYFNRCYQQIGSDPASYAHYQFSMVLQALEETESSPPNFGAALEDLFGYRLAQVGVFSSRRDPAPHPNLPEETLLDLNNRLVSFGVLIPPVWAECVYTPAVQRVAGLGLDD
jgi:hypothetical protein